MLAKTLVERKVYRNREVLCRLEYVAPLSSFVEGNESLFPEFQRIDNSPPALLQLSPFKRIDA